MCLQALEPQRRAVFLDTQGQALESGPHGAPVNAGKRHPATACCITRSSNQAALLLIA